MQDYRPKVYGERIAKAYDGMYPFVEEACIELLAEFSGKGRVLELGIGTGRIALPLKARGVDVHGIDASPAMVDQLKAKPGSSEIPVTIGDFAELAVDGSFDFIFVVFNTFFGLMTQELQLQCLQQVRQHLSDGGRFLIDAFVPDVTRFVNGQTVRAITVGEDEVRLEVSRHDRASQQVSSQHIVLSEKGVQLYPVKIRYAWPSELDMMARLAGLELVHRWEDWQKTPFSSGSDKHISVYGRI